MKRKVKNFIALLLLSVACAVAPLGCGRGEVSPTSSSGYSSTTEFTITFIADGVVIKRVKFIDGVAQSEIPAVPAKDRYTGTWETDDFTEEKTVNAVYALSVYLVHFETSAMYHIEGGKLVETKYGYEQTLADAYLSVSDKWRLPALKPFEIADFSYEKLQFIVKDENSYSVIENGTSIDPSLFTDGVITLYIKAQESQWV